jgi:hypothetical protein
MPAASGPTGAPNRQVLGKTTVIITFEMVLACAQINTERGRDVHLACDIGGHGAGDYG